MPLKPAKGDQGSDSPCTPALWSPQTSSLGVITFGQSPNQDDDLSFFEFCQDSMDKNEIMVLEKCPKKYYKAFWHQVLEMEQNISKT